MFCVGGNTNFMFHGGGNANFSVLDTRMLVYPTQNCGIGGPSQHKDLGNANGFASQWTIGFSSYLG